MAITPLLIPDRQFGQPIPVAPDMNQVVDKVDELVAAVNAGLGVSNAVVGGPKYVQYRLSGFYNVPAEAQTLDRLNPASILPGNQATVINSSDSPMSTTAPQKEYVATIVPNGTPGGIAVPAYAGASTTVLIVWQEVVSADSFTVLLASELSANKKAYAGLALRPLLIKLINELNTGSTVITQPADNTAPKAPTSGLVDDEANTFGGIAVTGFASYAEYEATGIPGTTGIVPLTADNSYQAGSRIYLKGLTGPLAAGTVGFRVAASGTRAAGAFLTNAVPFTGVVVLPNTPPVVTLGVGGSTIAPRFTATAADSDGIKSIFVKIYEAAAPTNLVATFGPSAPGDTSYITTWSAGLAGDYLARAIATDTRDLSAISDAVPFTVGAAPTPPTIASFTPTSGMVASTITVTGTNLSGLASATIGGVAAAISNNTATSVVLTVPADAVTGTIALTTSVGTATSSTVFTVSASATPVIIPITNANTFFNAYRQANDVRSSFAESRVYGTANQVEVTYEAPGYGETIAHIAVWDGNTFAGILQPTNAGTNVQVINLPGSSNRVFRFIDGGQQNINDDQTPKGSYVTQVKFPTGSSVALMQPVGGQARIFATVNSIGNGVNTQSGPRDAWPVILRATEPFDYIIDGWGYRSKGKSLGTPAKRTAQVGRIVSELSGAARKIYMDFISTNDAGLGYGSPSQVATISGALYDELHAADPAIEIRCYTTFYRKDIDVSQYTAALLGLASTRPWLKVIDTSSWRFALADNVHPSTEGSKQLAELIRQSLIGTQAVFGPGTYARVMGTENINPKQFTVIARIKANSDSTTGIVSSKASFKSIGGNAKTVGHHGFYLDPVTKKIQAAIYPAPDGSTEVNVVGNDAFEVAVYKKVAYVVDASSMYLRTNAELDTRALNGATPNATNDLIQISGANSYITNNPAEVPFDGILSNYSFFARALSQAEIDDIFSRDCRLNQQEYEDPDCIIYSTLARDNNATQLVNIADASKPIVLYGATTTPTPEPAGQTIEDGDENYITYGGDGWQPSENGNASGGHLYYTTQAGDANYSEVKFTNTILDIGYQREPFGGMVSVFLDGAFYDKFDQHADATIKNNVFRVTAASAGTHTVRVRRTDSSSSAILWADKYTAVNGVFIAR